MFEQARQRNIHRVALAWLAGAWPLIDRRSIGGYAFMLTDTAAISVNWPWAALPMSPQIYMV